jgi:Zn-dependent alcohol dehydrogenase
LVKFYDLAQINEAADDAEEGNTLKPVLRMG